MPKRGALIVIEGLDRSGKTTQCARLITRLHKEGLAAELIKFPDRTTAIGQMIDGYLRSQTELEDRAIHLLFSANRWELVTKIEALLAAGTLVICDRYAFSGVAFTAAKPSAPSVEWCAAPDAGLPAPDATLFLDVSPEVQRMRGGFGDERYENAERQGRVRAAFADLRRRAQPAWVTIDASAEPDEVEKAIWAVVSELAVGVDDELRRLWDGAGAPLGWPSSVPMGVSPDHKSA